MVVINCIQPVIKRTVTNNFVRLPEIVLGQLSAKKFAPKNVRPCPILSHDGSQPNGGHERVRKGAACPSRCERWKWIARTTLQTAKKTWLSWYASTCRRNATPLTALLQERGRYARGQRSSVSSMVSCTTSLKEAR